MDFRTAELMFRNDKIRELAEDPEGLRYLKLRSLSRREHLERLFELAGTSLPTKAREFFREAFSNSAIGSDTIESAIRDIYRTERNGRLEREPELVSQLYRLQMFDWGGLHQNSLEKTIVRNGKFTPAASVEVAKQNSNFPSVKPPSMTWRSCGDRSAVWKATRRSAFSTPSHFP